MGLITGAAGWPVPLAWLPASAAFSLSPSPPAGRVSFSTEHLGLKLSLVVMVVTIRPSINKLILSFTVIRDCGSKHLLLLMSLKVG